MAAFDGRGPATSLTDAVLAHWSLQTPPDLVGRVYRESDGTADIATLAALVDAAAGDGDVVALHILRAAGRELAITVEAVVRRLALPIPAPCALAGGAIVKGQQVRAAFLAALEMFGLRLDPITPVMEPAQGAIRLAAGLLRASAK